MAFLDTFKGKQYKKELDDLQRRFNDLSELMTPEVKEAFDLKQQVHDLEDEISELQSSIESLQKITADKLDDVKSLNDQIAEKRRKLVVMDDEICVQEFGLYTPQYEFSSSLGYKERLADIRAHQKEMIKNKDAVSGNMNWTVDGSSSKGKKMVSDFQKLLLRAFNSECDEIVDNVKYTNYDASLDRIYKSAESISKLGQSMGISVTRSYLSLKAKELTLAFEYQQKKQQEKEEQKLARAEMREAAKLQREIEAQRQKLEKEQTHYDTAYQKICAQLEAFPDNADLILKKAELESHLSEIEKALQDVDYREANQKAGYVYVISNIGSFGKDVYKIGMTRRLDPQDRVDELGDASVPFNFDVHAMIFSDDAPALEAALHKAFEDKKVNMVNHRREFFHVSLDEIKEVVRLNFDKTVEFIDIPDAEQYRVSEKMREQLY